MVSRPRSRSGFTLVELLVVMAIVALLLTIAVPRYFSAVDRSKETVLRQSLAVMRDAIDQFYADHGRYPDRLEDLVDKRYIRSIPMDPVTGSRGSWVVVAAPADAKATGTVYDVRSGAEGAAADGTRYGEW